MKTLLFLQILIAFQLFSLTPSLEQSLQIDTSVSTQTKIEKKKKKGKKKKKQPKITEIAGIKETTKITEYAFNPYVDPNTWELLKPYFLPIDHPMKPALDEIFHNNRLVSNRESFINGGFLLFPPKGEGNLVVGRHEQLPGYLVKAYFDHQHNCEWDNFYNRITGANSIRGSIAKHGFEHLFKVPEKWIYPLPPEPSPLAEGEVFRKNFVLVVENMNVLSHHSSKKIFLSKITPDMLDALFTIVTEEGLIDSVFSGNIPFNRAGQMNFIDTEHHHKWPVPYHHLIRYLNPDMQAYWQHLKDTRSHNP